MSETSALRSSRDFSSGTTGSSVVVPRNGAIAAQFGGDHCNPELSKYGSLSMYVVLGGRGYVGQAIQQALSRRNIPFQVLSRQQLDYSDLQVLAEFLKAARPTFLINTAGYTGRPNVDACELHRTECLDGNAVLPGVIREACETTGTAWGHVSSGCIYTGVRDDGAGFTEEDPPNFSFRQNNCSFYSGSKALGEEILAGAANCYLWRLRIPFNNHDSPRNYISKMMRYDRLLNATNSLSQLDEFADACIDCHVRQVPPGIYNMTNPGHVTTREVVDLIRRHGLSRREFSFFDSESQFMQQAAKTPRSNCVLDSSKAITAGLKLTPINAALDQAMSTWVPESAGRQANRV